MTGRPQRIRVCVPAGTVTDTEGRATVTYTESVVRGQVGPDPKAQYSLGDQVGAMAETATAAGRLPRGTYVTKGTMLRVEGNRFGDGVYQVTAHSEDRRGVYVRCIDRGDT